MARGRRVGWQGPSGRVVPRRTNFEGRPGHTARLCLGPTAQAVKRARTGRQVHLKGELPNVHEEPGGLRAVSEAPAEWRDDLPELWILSRRGGAHGGLRGRGYRGQRGLSLSQGDGPTSSDQTRHSLTRTTESGQRNPSGFRVVHRTGEFEKRSHRFTGFFAISPRGGKVSRTYSDDNQPSIPNCPTEPRERLNSQFNPVPSECSRRARWRTLALQGVGVPLPRSWRIRTEPADGNPAALPERPGEARRPRRVHGASTVRPPSHYEPISRSGC
jgi:hypothetical protein